MLVSKHSLHKPLKCTRRVAKSKWHAVPFEVAEWSAEGHFGRISLCNRYLIVTTGLIKGGKGGEGIQGFLDSRQREGILLGLIIELAVINTQARAAILLLDKNDGG